MEYAFTLECPARRRRGADRAGAGCSASLAAPALAPASRRAATATTSESTHGALSPAVRLHAAAPMCWRAKPRRRSRCTTPAQAVLTSRCGPASPAEAELEIEQALPAGGRSWSSEGRTAQQKGTRYGKAPETGRAGLPAWRRSSFSGCVIGWLHWAKPQLLGSAVSGGVIASAYVILYLLWWGLAPAATACVAGGPFFLWCAALLPAELLFALVSASGKVWPVGVLLAALWFAGLLWFRRKCLRQFRRQEPPLPLQRLRHPLWAGPHPRDLPPVRGPAGCAPAGCPGRMGHVE